MKKERGALALEATIAFTVFISFIFMLMAIVRLSMVYITINDVTAEAAKRAAGMAYPISVANDFIDEKAQAISLPDISNKVLSEINKEKGRTNSIFETFGIGVTSNAINEAGFQDFLSNLETNLASKVFDGALTFIEQKQVDFVASIYENLIDETHMPIDKSKIQIEYFTMPQSETMFKLTEAKIDEVTGFEADQLSKDDVVLVVDYDYTLAVPFFPARNIRLRSISVEKGWLNGGNHTGPSKREGVDVENLVGDVRTVYYTKSGKGKKYHKNESCVALSRSGDIGSMGLKDARSKGLKPCSLCKPDES